MLARNARAAAGRVFTPPARLLLRLGVSPDAVTVVGHRRRRGRARCGSTRAGSCFWGTLVIFLFVFCDTLDGTMARLSGRSSKWGAFLDSTLDRVADAAIFVGLALWFAGRGRRARAGLGVPGLPGRGPAGVLRAGPRRGARAGWQRGPRRAHRAADRGAHRRPRSPGSACPTCWPVVLWLLAAATWFTVVQRMLHVRRQVLAGVSGAARRGHLGRLRDRLVGGQADARVLGQRRSFRALADRAYARDGAGVRQLRAQPGPGPPRGGRRRARGPRRGPGCARYLRYWVEAFRLPGGPPERIVATHRIEGDQHIVDALAAGRGRGHRPAAHRQLGPRRGVGHLTHEHASPRWPSGSSPSRSTSGSSTTASRWGWRSSR